MIKTNFSINKNYDSLKSKHQLSPKFKLISVASRLMKKYSTKQSKILILLNYVISSKPRLEQRLYMNPLIEKQPSIHEVS